MGYKLICNQTLSFMLRDEKMNFLKFKYEIRISYQVKDENNVLPSFFFCFNKGSIKYLYFRAVL
jgi:hypothetical protein